MNFADIQIPPEIMPWILPVSVLCIGVALSLWVIYVGSLWLIYNKAGRSGWLIFIPLINIYVLLKIVGRPGWYFLLLLIPLVNLIVLIFLWFELGKVFGKGTGFGLGLLFFHWIFVVILAFDRSEYQLKSPRKPNIDDFQPINVRPT